MSGLGLTPEDVERYRAENGIGRNGWRKTVGAYAAPAGEAPADPRLVERQLVRARRDVAEAREAVLRFSRTTRYGAAIDFCLLERLMRAQEGERTLRGELRGEGEATA